jgi:hypothetical protein
LGRLFTGRNFGIIVEITNRQTGLFNGTFDIFVVNICLTKVLA